MRSFSRPSTLIRHIQMTRCIPPYTEEVEHDNNEYMETSSSSSGDSHDVSHDERNEDNQATSSSYDFNFEGGKEYDARSYSTIQDSLSNNSMFSCEYQFSSSDNVSTTDGEIEFHDDHCSSQSSSSSLSSTPHYIYDSEDIDFDFDEEEEEEIMIDNLPPAPIDLVEARLLELMMKYSVPLGAYKSFLEWAKLCVNTKYDFESSKKTFGANIKRLLNHESQGRNQPTENILPGRGQLPDVSVYTFPFLENAKYMYSQEMLMANSIWKYDASSEVYGESNTGLWWKEAEENMMLRLHEYDIPNQDLHYIAPVTMFIDNTHCDRNGRLQAEPCLVSFGNICLEQRKKSSSYFFLGLLPSKLLSSSEREKLKAGNGLRSDYLRMYHDALRIILNELHALQIHDRANGGGTPMNVYGKGEVFLHFEINLVIGDTSGHDILTGHNQCYSKKSHRPIRSCNVKWDDLDDHNSQCDCNIPKETYDLIQKCMNKILSRRKVTKYRNVAKGISHQLVIPALHELGYGGVSRGVFCATPFEILHTLMLGTMKYTLHSLYNFQIQTETITTNPSNGNVTRTTKVSKPLMEDEIERRIRTLSMHSKRQSDRDMPRAVFNKGVTQLSGIQGQEYVGLSILTIAALPGMLKDITAETQFIKLLWKGISLCSILSRDEVPKEELISGFLLNKIRNYNELFVKVCGDQRYYESPSVGCKLPKLHGLTHMPLQIEDHGSPENFNGSYLESMLKEFIKRPGRRTRRTHADFALDLINRWSEFSCITDYMSSVDKSELEDAVLTSSHNNEILLPNERGVTQENNGEPAPIVKMIRKAFSYRKCGNEWHTICGRTTHLQVIHPYCELLKCQLSALKSFLTTEMHQLNVEHVDCYYEMRLTEEDSTQIFRCNPSYRNEPWFDFVYVDYMNSSNVSSSCASMLLLWLTFEDPISHEKKLYALTHSLTSQNTPPWRFLPAWKGDRLHSEAKVVHYDTSISGVAYVLPGVDPFLIDVTDRSEKGKLIFKKVLDNKYFLVIPQRHDWANIGWNDVTT
jgi:hypothetical protein